MTATAPAPGARAERGTPGDPGAAPDQRIAPPPKMRRRPAMIALSIACIAVGGLAAAWAWQTTSSTNTVLAARETVLRGEVIEAADVIEVQVGTDPAVAAIPAELVGDVVGRTAGLDIAQGSVFTYDQVQEEPIPAPGRSVVGLSLPAGLMPQGQVRNGDAVRVVTTDGETGTTDATATGVAGIVRGLSSDEVSGNAIANVEVSAEEAVRVASAASAGKVALILEHQAGDTSAGTADDAATDPAPEQSPAPESEGDAAGAGRSSGDQGGDGGSGGGEGA